MLVFIAFSLGLCFIEEFADSYIAILVSPFFIYAGLDKFFHFMPMPKDLPEKMLKAFDAFTEIGWLMPLVGIAELLGGLLIILPRTRALGALIIFPVMVGIALTNIVQDQREDKGEVIIKTTRPLR